MGNIEINASALRACLKKSHYWLTYDTEKRTITLNENGGYGGKTLFAISGTSHENAARLAQELGLKAGSEKALTWTKWNPRLTLHHDDSEEADVLRTQMLKLGIPHRVIRDATLGLADERVLYRAPSFNFAQMMDVILDTAEHYNKQLSETP